MIPELTAQQQAAAFVLGGLTTLCFSANQILGIYQKIISVRMMRDPVRTPPLGEEAAKLYATKNEVSALRTEFINGCAGRHKSIDKTLASIFNIIRAAATKQSDWQNGVNQQLGRIDGTMEMIKEQLHKP